MKTFGLIYKATRKKDGKSYVGMTTKSAMARIKDHLNKPNKNKSYFDIALKNKRKQHKGWIFKYANQSGSTLSNVNEHAQRIGLEPDKSE